MLIPRLASKIQAGELITIFRNGRPRSNAMYVTDLTEVIRRALQLDRSVTLNVAHPETFSIRDLCRELESIFGRPGHYQEADREAGDLVADVSSMEKALGFRATVPLAVGLRRMWGQA
jgi:nucleoside-diphosphate-sugar epimerase